MLIKKPTTNNKELKHYGIIRRSGRYPWGSGDDPYQRLDNFLDIDFQLKKEGFSDDEIAKNFGMNIAQLRKKRSLRKTEYQLAQIYQANKLKEKGYSNVKIGEIMNRSESSIRMLLEPRRLERAKITKSISDTLKQKIDEKSFIDVGVGVEKHIDIGISRGRLKTAIEGLKEEGYFITYVPIPQEGTTKKTNLMVLSKPTNDIGKEVFKLRNDGLNNTDIASRLKLKPEEVNNIIKNEYSNVFKNKDKISQINAYSEDGGRTFLGIEKPRSIDSKRIAIRYYEDGGGKKDGVIELRMGVPELSLGTKRYAQVRIAVDDTHFLKGMALYSKTLPEGIDIIYNTNKSKDVKKHDVFKRMVDDPDNPFKSVIRQTHYIDDSGKKQLSALNIVGYPTKEGSGEEGDWGKWTKSISSQILSKQSHALAEKQLSILYKSSEKEFNEINSLTNPVVKKVLLNEFSDDCDSKASHLVAAALPRQQSHIILPINNIKKTEVYAPNYRNGEKVVLIRHPHGGIFEIPELIVNNKNREGREILGQAIDAVGIHTSVAQQLSGADFDGDTVLVIPNNKKHIKTAASIKSLINFDPKLEYPEVKDMVYMTKSVRDLEMGNITNLITDMTIKGANVTGANIDEIARAIKHSMVVIDAERHKLNYKQSAIDNGIAALKLKYQGKKNAGAATIISRASSEKAIKERKLITNIHQMNETERKNYLEGKKVYRDTNRSFIDKEGKERFFMERPKKMDLVEDAKTLSSGTMIENIYANHANKLKHLANLARKESRTTKVYTASASAKKVYSKEVASLTAQYNIVLKNKPLERQARLITNKIVSEKISTNKNIDKEDRKKLSYQVLTEQRQRWNAKRTNINISPKEWEAIQARAISPSLLSQILVNADMDKVKAYATPRTTQAISQGKIQRIKQMASLGYTQAEIADQLDISINKVKDAIN